MRRCLAILALATLGVVACGKPPLQYSFTDTSANVNVGVNGASGTSGNNNGSDGGFPDAGLEAYLADAGLPTAECAGDLDGTAAGPPSGLVISELGLNYTPNFVEFFNRGAITADLSSYTFSGVLAGLTFPQESIAPSDRGIVVASLPSTGGEIGISLGSTLVFYVCWGPAMTTTLQSEAVTAGLWASLGSCETVPNTGYTLHLRGAGTQIPDWFASLPTPFGCSTTP